MTDFRTTDSAIWLPAGGQDVPAIVRMAQNHFEREIDNIFVPDPIAYSRNIAGAIVNQFYSPGSELLFVAKSQQTGAICAYTWVHRNQRSPWSDEEMAAVRMAHLDLELPSRDRIRLVLQMIAIWEAWCDQYGIPILCSTTMRGDQSAFLKLHSRAGFDVRGSYAYKRIKEITC